jgi:hypothetical protein
VIPAKKNDRATRLNMFELSRVLNLFAQYRLIDRHGISAVKTLSKVQHSLAQLLNFHVKLHNSRSAGKVVVPDTSSNASSEFHPKD